MGVIACRAWRKFGAGFLVWAASSAYALDDIKLRVPDGTEEGLRDTLVASSILRTSEEELPTGRDVYAAALADYRRLTETLYAEGYYNGVISIKLDGREASAVSPLSVPNQISMVLIEVEPGEPFRFGRAEIGPLVPETVPLPEFSRGERARAGAIRDAAQTAVDDWRDAGFAEAAVADQRVVADHARRRLDTDLTLDPGRRYVFGRLVVGSESAVRSMRIRRIGGLPEGETFSPAELDQVVQRLRRTGAFSSVVLKERPSPSSGVVDIVVEVADEAPRRFGFGAELSSLEGLELSAYWFHRNLLGGAERLRFDAEISNIGTDEAGGIDYFLGSRITTPGRFGADTVLFAFANYTHEDEPDYLSDRLEAGIGATRYISSSLEGEFSLTYTYAETEDELGDRTFQYLSFPLALTWDRRNDQLNPTQGLYVRGELRPFSAIEGLDSGLRSTLDARGYYGIDEEDRFVLAGRLQFGSVYGPDITETPQDFLFYSGGGGTVRGQSYQSLGVTLPGGVDLGGRSFVGLSGEVRVGITEALGAVVFADTGYVGAEEFYDGSGMWHSGGGLGIRYNTGIGPVRFDVATPLGDNAGEDVQIYLGIGQAF
ncbi:autotransporter secretion outer membrane protein TamA [Poseidonocella pacifica]|uniref:Autotransporter secretion outer membrane protein TamA n=1 Tax=Poseidonocella pacifica TaxID=871651 RepID=A0A1I0WSE0_9RHOB|nr:autotransporter assembly complex family protein [Poseidonocella pacifica]SFA90926.1 autotransporter secretion outer membrane protein TamA [Poseidonocella pacifica]